MSFATNLAIIGLAATAFFGLGGVGKTREFIDSIKSSPTVSKIIDNTKTVSLPNATQTQQISQPEPKQQQNTQRIQTIIIDSRNPPSQQAKTIPVSKATLPQTQAQRKQFERELTKNDPFLTRSTSLEGAQFSTGPQIKRGTSKFNEVKQAEAKRAEEIFRQLFGNVSNPNF